MAQASDGSEARELPDASWRDRALERSLRAARANAISRSDRFISTAMEILQETGRTDFTVQELVDRSHTSLRSFYQYFAGKDELLLAVLEERAAVSVAGWRTDTEGIDALSALRIVVTKVYGGDGEEPTLRHSRALATYQIGLVSTHFAEYSRALAPVVELIRDLVRRGVEDGVLRADIPADDLAAILIRTVLGAAMMNVVNAGEDFDGAVSAAALWEFCRMGLVRTPENPDPATPPRTRAGRA